MTLLARLAAAVDSVSPGNRVAVAIDGPDAAGKTTLADALGEHVTRPALRVSVDQWHNPRSVRLRRGAESPLGYYLDSFDHDALTAHLLRPFRGGAARVRTAHYDFRADAPDVVETEVARDAVLLLDGVFLLRPELRHHWDLSVYLHVPEAVTLERARVRDAEALGGADHVQRRYERRYLPGQALYREAASPMDAADVVIGNSDPVHPQVLRWCV